MFKLNRLGRALFPGHFRVLWILLLAFLAANAAVRLGLTLFFREWSVIETGTLAPAMLIGALFDLAVATFVLAPMALALALWPRQGTAGSARNRVASRVLSIVVFAMCAVSITVAASEFVFWNEFGVRFNFIAVDYLVYTHEVLGNIEESYNLRLIFAGIGVLALLAWLALREPIRRALLDEPAARGLRWRVAGAWLLAPLLAGAAIDARYQDFSDDAAADQLAGNGYFDFMHAFWSNEIDYPRFYRTLAPNAAARALGPGVGLPEPGNDGAFVLERAIAARAAEQHRNVVLVTIESLGADMVGSFGDPRRLTPNLDRLAAEGLLFTQAYATGTRTVRGLEAVTLSMPPTPGDSIVKRPDNANLFSLGSVFKAHGYDTLYVYGGYSYFDNMQAFFAGNGYTVVDRSAMPQQQVHYANIWGICDEDLFTLALTEFDRRAADGKAFFGHIMTVSNHRPYTYPDGRVDTPSGSGREGAVKYTDYAIGKFIAEAKTRPWFANTVFVFIADHTSKGRGRTDLPIETFHVPWIVYAPGFVAPQTNARVVSQIDVPPTILGLLNFSYRSRFFGFDALDPAITVGRALIGNYQTVGLYRAGTVVELKPQRRARAVDAISGVEMAPTAATQQLIDEATGYYQLASEAYTQGVLRLNPTPSP